MKVTRVAYSHRINKRKLAGLTEQARRLGAVRSLVWQRYGSVSGASLRDRQVRDQWMADGTAQQFGVSANAWKETVRDAMADIKANREAAKVHVRRTINRRAIDGSERKRLFTALKSERWADDRFLRARVRTVTFEAVHAVVDKARLVAAEDLTKPFASKSLGREMNVASGWTKGVTAEALQSVSERRGSVLVHVNAAYTSQVDPMTGGLAVRRGDRLHCASGVVWQADHAAAINILQRAGDPDITLWTPHKRVKQILQERADRQRIRLPIQDSSSGSGAESERSKTCSRPDRFEQQKEADRT